MLEVQPDTAIPSFTLAPPWTPEELALLVPFTTVRATRAQIEAAIPGRTHRAIRKQLTQLRNQLQAETPGGRKAREYRKGRDDHQGMLAPTDPGVYNTEHRDWKAKARESNRLYLAALARAGYRVVELAA